MRATAWGLAGGLGLMLWMLAAVPGPARPPQWRPPRPSQETRAFAPAADRDAAVPTGMSGVRHGAKDGADALQPHPEPWQRAFREAGDLALFALEQLPAAEGGDGARQYAIYLALEECRDFLHGDFEGRRMNLERMAAVADLDPEEQALWSARLQRCRGFSARDWSALGSALGEDDPAAPAEYAWAWFERAADTGYPPALAEQALRPGPYGVPERESLLEQALAAPSAQVYWLLFAHSAEVQDGAINAPALAWLMLACRAGAECGEAAPWYRAYACAGRGGCPPGQSALDYYWGAATPSQRAEAMAQAAEIQGLLAQGRWREAPLPALELRDLRRLWARADAGGATP